MKDLTALFDAAVASSLPSWAAELRGQYRAAGVAASDAASVTVTGSDNLSVKGNQAVWDVEYGTEESQPQAIARSYGSNSPKGSSVFLSKLSAKVKGL